MTLLYDAELNNMPTITNLPNINRASDFSDDDIEELCLSDNDGWESNEMKEL